MKEKESFKNTLTLTSIIHLRIALGWRKFIVHFPKLKISSER